MVLIRSKKGFLGIGGGDNISLLQLEREISEIFNYYTGKIKDPNMLQNRDLFIVYKRLKGFNMTTQMGVHDDYVGAALSGEIELRIGIEKGKNKILVYLKCDITQTETRYYFDKGDKPTVEFKDNRVISIKASKRIAMMAQGISINIWEA